MDRDGIERYMAMAERGIAAAAEAENISGHFLEGWQGPQTLTFRFAIHRPTAALVARALRMGPAIEGTLRVGAVRMQHVHGVIHVEIPSPWPIRVPGSRLRGWGLFVPVGLTGERDSRNRQLVGGFDFGKSPHLLAVGATGTGKTTALLSLVFHLARQNSPGEVRFVIVVREGKAPTWAPAAGLAHTCAVVTDDAESAQALRWAAREADRRRGKPPTFFVVVDDLVRLLEVAGEVAGELSSIASLGREAGVRLLLGTQRVGRSGTGAAAVAGNIRDRLVFGAASAQDAALFSGRPDTGAEKLLGAGDALIVGGEGVKRVAVAAVGAEDWTKLPPSPAEWRPWRSGESGVGVGVGVGVDEVPATPTVPSNILQLPQPQPQPNSRGRGWRLRARTNPEAVRAAYAETGGDLTATCRKIFGYKDDVTLAIAKEMLG